MFDTQPLRGHLVIMDAVRKCRAPLVRISSSVARPSMQEYDEKAARTGPQHRPRRRPNPLHAAVDKQLHDRIAGARPTGLSPR
jgi:hypothetical protein